MKEIYVHSGVLRNILTFVCEYLGIDVPDPHLGIEVSGFLLGHHEGNKIVINDYLTGDQISRPLYTAMTDDFLASVAQDVKNGKIKGSIQGWFHSHLGAGLFLSSRDLKTLKNMQRLYPDAVALVVDPLTNERFRFFRYDFSSEKLRVVNVHVYGGR